MSVITKDLGVATAYGYAKSKGYTGTEEEFAELMASYADVAQQAEAAAQDAEDAKDEAVTAKTDAQTAKTAAQAAQSAAETASGTASAKASEAAQSAQSAAGSASAAQTSATAASGSASTAQTAAQTATNKASEASSSASAASTAKTGAETARTGAQTAQAAAETAQANAEAAASSVSASAAQIEQNTEDIAGLKNDFMQFPNGTYPNMTVGNADQLTATVGIEDNAPYLYRTSGGSNDIGDREDVKKIVGGTIVNNQLVQNGNFEDTSIWVKSNVTATASNNVLTVEQTTADGYVNQPIYWGVNHKILTVVELKGDVGVKYRFNAIIPIAVGTGDWQTVSGIISTAGVVGYLVIGTVETTEPKTFYLRNVRSYDLTLTLGTSIADYVYSLESATAGAGVAWLKKNFPKQFDAGYQAYDAGSMQSVSGLTEHRMVGFNQFNSEAGTVRIIGGMQYQITGTYTALSLDGTTITPDSNGKFTPTNSGTLTVTGGNATDTCVHFVWDGEKDGTYEPYKTWSYALDDSITLRGIPKVDANGNLYYDGDEYLPDGTVNRYWAERAYQSGDESDGSTMITDGTKTVYKLATPTTETALPYQETQIVDDFGTEEFVLADGAFPVPVGHNTMYQNNLRAKLEMSPDSPDGDGLYVVQQESGENTYVPLASTATIQDILTRLTALENA